MIRLLTGLLILMMALQGDEKMKVATYNVENLFDLHFSGDEYPEYIPNTSWQWDRRHYQDKLHNIAKVITDMAPDIIALQEVESLQALKDLKKEIKRQGHYMPHHAFAGAKNTTVKVALLSRYPIVYAREIPVSESRRYRAILEVKIDVEGHPFFLFVNHWKSKSGPESRRIVSAKALRKRIDALGADKAILVLGDLNSHYEEYLLFRKKRKHNDTNGKTGIDHVLSTLCDGDPTTLKTLRMDPRCMYNLWYESPQKQRWTHKYFGQKETLDHMIISAGLYDGKGVDYLPNSFQKFTPDYLFEKGTIYRWQRSRKYPKHHTGKGYSDHLPIFATFIVK